MLIHQSFYADISQHWFTQDRKLFMLCAIDFFINNTMRMHTVTKIVSAHNEQGTKTLPDTVDNAIIEVFFL